MMRHATHQAPASSVSTRPVRWALLAAEVFSGVNALGGGIGLVVNGLGVPKSQLAGTPFDSFLIPGLLLAIVVGGSMLGAAVVVWRRLPLAGLASMGAGAIMLGWIAVEALMIHDGRPLQVTIAALALVVLALGWLLARADARDHA